jgi:hypothetical protein
MPKSSLTDIQAVALFAKGATLLAKPRFSKRDPGLSTRGALWTSKLLIHALPVSKVSGTQMRDISGIPGLRGVCGSPDEEAAACARERRPDARDTSRSSRKSVTCLLTAREVPGLTAGTTIGYALVPALSEAFRGSAAAFAFSE